MLKSTLLIAADGVFAASVSGCQTTSSSPKAAYRPASYLDQVRAYCELAADSIQPVEQRPQAQAPVVVITQNYGGYSSGYDGYSEAGYAIGSAIGGAIVHSRHYDQCMTLKGYSRN